MNEIQSENNAASMSNKGFLTFCAWTIILLVSDLPDVLLHTLKIDIPDWLFSVKIVILVVFLLLCFTWKKIRPLWSFSLMLLVFYLALKMSDWLKDTGWWSGLFAGTQTSFTISYAEALIRDTGIALVVIAVLWLVYKKRQRFFLVKGDLKATIEPVRWLGIKSGESWRVFGWIFALVALAVVFIPTFFSMHITSEMVAKILPLLPAVILFAAVNAFNEEIYFRVSTIATLYGILDKSHVLLMTAVFFGLAHYLHGSPPGMIGFLMTGFLAWLLGKSIYETKGFFWAWFIHFLPDVAIFAFYAMSWE